MDKGVILQCRVLMYDHKMEDMVGKGDESWHDCAIDLRDISSVRRCHDENKEDCGVAHFKHGDYFIVDLEYSELLTAWKKALNL